jgi:glutamyl-tRNA synthetase
MAEQADFLFREFADFEEKAAGKHLKAAAEEPLTAVITALEAIEDWRAENIQQAMQTVVDEMGIGLGKLGQPLRVAITGRGAAPGNDQALEVLGLKTAVKRINRALAFIAARKQAAENRGS